MKKPTVLACLMLLTARLVAGAEGNPDAPFDARRLNRELPGTWECVSQADQPREVRLIKHVTPTHYTWVAYDRDQKAILVVSGGTWSLKDGNYEESCEFASDNVQHLRGKTYRFTINIVGDKWDHKGVPGTEIAVDQVWTRLKPADLPKKNTGEPGRQLLGTWEIAQGPGAPKAMRMIKHVTPTHWTWVIYDRENKMVLAAAGGAWSLRDGEYAEDCDFTTDNFQQARGKSPSYGFRLDGDHWILKGGPNGRLSHDEDWARLRRPNP